MKGKRIMADSNVVLYAFAKNEDVRKHAAIEILAAKPCISVQVVSEVLSVLYRKFSFNHEQAQEVCNVLTTSLQVFPVGVAEIAAALTIKSKTGYSYWDSLIIATALQNRCDFLYTEDLHHEQKIDDKLTIINPFA